MAIYRLMVISLLKDAMFPLQVFLKKNLELLIKVYISGFLPVSTFQTVTICCKLLIFLLTCVYARAI